MMDELIDRLAIRLAKVEGWDVKRLRSDDPRSQQWRNMARACLEEIDVFLKEEEMSFDELEVSDRYNWGAE